MLREHRRLVVPELDAVSAAVELRTPFLRVCVLEGENVATDWAVVQRATPFVERMARTSVSVVLEGRGRFDERGEHHALAPGTLALSDHARGGTEAYAGARTRVLIAEWDPRVLGARHGQALTTLRLDARTLARLGTFAGELGAADLGRATRAVDAIARVLRAEGLALAPFAVGDRITPALAEERRLAATLGAQLSRLREHPDLEDVGSALGASARHVHRRLGALAAHYQSPWPSWRALLRHYRFVSALRLLSAPGATTERVAEATGFRAPAALCHAFEKAGLPPPGTFVRDARRDPLEGWLAHGAVVRPMAASAA